jgi:hypothetical protein
VKREHITRKFLTDIHNNLSCFARDLITVKDVLTYFRFWLLTREDIQIIVKDLGTDYGGLALAIQHIHDNFFKYYGLIEETNRIRIDKFIEDNSKNFMISHFESRLVVKSRINGKNNNPVYSEFCKLLNHGFINSKNLIVDLKYEFWRNYISRITNPLITYFVPRWLINTIIGYDGIKGKLLNLNDL